MTDSVEAVARAIAEAMGRSWGAMNGTTQDSVCFTARAAIAAMQSSQAERIERLEAALRDIIADGDNEDMDAETAWSSMYDRARAALNEKDPTPD